ncbi:MAG: PAS domain S-box protein [Acidobacteria bacterium]|nr:PAS domain S-box protein [Acidobacteriota bacterium]
MSVPTDSVRPGPPPATASGPVERAFGFTRLLEATQIVQWEADAQTRDFTYVGAQAERLLGYPIARWLEPAFWKTHIHPDDLDGVLRFREEALREHDAYEFEYRMVAAGGASVWVRDVVAVQRLDGRAAVIRGVLIDISKRKRAEAIARASEARVRQLIEQAPDAIIAARANGQIAFVNQQAERLFGYQPGALSGGEIEQVLPGQLVTQGLAAPLAGRPAADTADGGEPVTARCADGRTFPAAVNFGRLETDEGPVVVTTVRDVSRQVEAEQALRQSEERFRIAATLGADLIAEVDLETSSVVWFGNVDEAMGFDPGQFPRTLGRLRDQLHPEDRSRVEKAIAREVYDARSAVSFECRMQSKDRSYRHWTVRAAPRADGDGASKTFVAVCSDVTEPIVARAEALQHRDALAHVARVSSLGELTGAVAHELNQPLAAILSNAQAAVRLLDREAPDVRQVREVLHDIVADDRRASAIIQRLREMMRGESPSREPIDLGTVVREVREIMRSGLSMRGIAVLSEFAPDLPPVVADRIQIQQVVVNLVTNAMHAMDELSEASLTFRVFQRRDGWQVVAVEDTGRGITPTMRATMFDPFNTSREGGLGMGLSISRSIIEAHGGEMQAGPLPAGGATVGFVLPPAR